jgi:hypothetical protein
LKAALGVRAVREKPSLPSWVVETRKFVPDAAPAHPSGVDLPVVGVGESGLVRAPRDEVLAGLRVVGNGGKERAAGVVDGAGRRDAELVPELGARRAQALGEDLELVVGREPVGLPDDEVLARLRVVGDARLGRTARGVGIRAGLRDAQLRPERWQRRHGRRG